MNTVVRPQLFHALPVAGLTLMLALSPSARALEVGDEAPPLGLEALIGAPDDADISWDALRGSVVILEFWGIKCGPCVEAIPHLNEMVEVLADEPLRVISITDDAEVDVDQFLQRQPIAGWIGLDTDRSTFPAYDLRAVPTTVVVGTDGRIVAITHPTALQVEEVEALCQGTLLDPDALQTGIPFVVGLDRGETGPVTKRMEIRPAEALAGGTVAVDRDRVTILGRSAFQMVASVLGVSPARIRGEEHLPQGRWDLIAADPGADRELFRAELRAVLEDTFQVTLISKVDESRVHVLGPGSRGGPQMSPREEGTGTLMQIGTHGLTLRNADAEQLASCLENLTGEPVLDESGLEGVFDAELVRNPSFPLDLFRQVRLELGLSVRRERREIEFVVIGPAGADVDVSDCD